MRAAVIICPSLGLEAGFSYFALRCVADTLAEIGFLVCRFDYDGTGDSAGQTDDPARVAAWQSSIDSAIELVRSMTDGPITLLGMRIGALLASSAAHRRGDVDGLVLWDPPKSGRSYLREQRARHGVSLGAPEDESSDDSAVWFLGTEYSAETVEALGALSLGALADLPVRQCLVLERPGQSSMSRQVERAGSDKVVVTEADGQDALLLLQVTPDDTIARVVTWFSAAYESNAYVDVREVDVHEMTDCVGYGKTTVTEHIVRLGPHSLFGIVSEPEAPPRGPTIIFVPDSHTPHIGLSRMWVDLARQWAGAGLRVLRFDLSGNGDSKAWPGSPAHQRRAVDHLDDVRHAMEAVSSADPSDTVLVGICSGAYECIEAALELQPRGIAVINPGLTFIPTERPVSKRRKARLATRRIITVPFGRVAGRLARRLSPVLSLEDSFEWDYWLDACFWQQSLARRTSRLPAWVWAVLNWLMLEQRPVAITARMVRSGTDVYMLFGDPEMEYFSLGAGRSIKKLANEPNFAYEHLAGLDHSVLGAGQRTRTTAALTRAITERWTDNAASSTTERVGVSRAS